jgi:DNA gyrase subunit A
MGRATSGVIGMRFSNGDQLLGMHVVDADASDVDVLVATGGGYAKRTPASQYPLQGRGGLGVVTARIVEARGELIGALMVRPDDEVFAITSGGGVIRTAAAEVKQSGRQTMGVRLVNLTGGQTLVAIARNAEIADSEAELADSEAELEGGLDAGSAEADSGDGPGPEIEDSVAGDDDDDADGGDETVDGDDQEDDVE